MARHIDQLNALAAVLGTLKLVGAEDGQTELKRFTVDMLAGYLLGNGTVKTSAAIATTANILLTGEQTIDGVLTSGTRVLVKDQTTTAENGIYTSASGAWSRVSDADTWAEVYGAFIIVNNGTVNNNTVWLCTGVANGVVGVTAMPWIRVHGGNVFMPWHAHLAQLNADWVADRYFYTTGANTLSQGVLSAFARTVLDDANANAAKTTLGVNVIDSAFASYATNADLTAQIPLDDTFPEITEGSEILSLSFTPKSVTNKFRARFQGIGSISGSGTYVIAGLFLGGTTNALAAAISFMTNADRPTPLALEHEWVPGTTSAQTLSVRVGPTTAVTLRMNGISTARRLGGAMRATLAVEEILA